MPTIAKLADQLPEITQSRLVASGYGVWMVWSGKMNAAIGGTLREYGVIEVVREEDQALWFCNTVEVFRAVARLQIWAKVNNLKVFCQIFPMTMLVGYSMEFSMSLAAELDRQTAKTPSEFEVWIHPKLKDAVAGVPGLSTREWGQLEGLAPVDWLALNVDQSLDYESTLRWYFIIKPLGRMTDKESIVGWRDFSGEITELIKRLGLKYISDVNEGFLFFPLDSFRLLKTFCSEILSLIRDVKDDEERQYWPIVMAAVPQGRLPFSEEMPKKVGLDWNRLAPDFPHVRIADGFLLSDSFHINEARYGTEQISLDSWVNISLKDGGEQDRHGTIQVALPNVLVDMEGAECFYCGQKNHAPGDCPTKRISKLYSNVWKQLAQYNLEEIGKGMNNIDSKVSVENFEDMLDLVADKKNIEGVLARAIFEINVPCQLRTLNIMWRSRAKEWADAMKSLAPPEGEYIWDALHKLQERSYDEAEELIKQATLKYQRSYQPHSLSGFLFLDRGDPNQALFHWQEAERMSYTPMQQGYFSFLQGRLMEVEGSLKEAVTNYKRANSFSPTWLEPVYRQGVCMVKMGFTGQALDVFRDLVSRDPDMFNRILVDPELDRGRVQIMSAMWEWWADAEDRVKQVREDVKKLFGDITERFDENHHFFEVANEELERLRRYGEVDNYVSFRMLLRGKDKFSSRLDNEVAREVKRINANVEYLSDRIREIQREAAWFPFPKLLLEFNKDFNFCVDKINWIKTQPLRQADIFRKSMRFLDEIEEHIDTLQGRLVTLRIVRDSTLFVLMLGRNFIWFELIGLGLALVGLPAFIYFTRDVQGHWIVESIRSQQWEFTKGLVIILSVLCLAGAAIKSGLGFEKRKRELFEQLDEEMRSVAPRRY
ncbi:tetratricopeptide repeat protein [Pseudodesulfovibrio tunisiensis]|uniref:tetratricopeptide repeat protein n=1 Tax=Pseudodesulfovibrio tunisiensis TaxID=463192 RepID=UPI001FB3E68B|nr:tetratricopeptide repeat protein [Pseudodesulfovibrio tunisiensis]